MAVRKRDAALPPGTRRPRMQLSARHLQSHFAIYKLSFYLRRMPSMTVLYLTFALLAISHSFYILQCNQFNKIWFGNKSHNFEVINIFNFRQICWKHKTFSITYKFKHKSTYKPGSTASNYDQCLNTFLIAKFLCLLYLRVDVFCSISHFTSLMNK